MTFGIAVIPVFLYWGKIFLFIELNYFHQLQTFKCLDKVPLNFPY